MRDGRVRVSHLRWFAAQAVSAAAASAGPRLVATARIPGPTAVLLPARVQLTRTDLRT